MALGSLPRGKNGVGRLDALCDKRESCLGFDVAALVLNSLPQDFLAEMVRRFLALRSFSNPILQCQDVLAFLQCKIGAVDITRLRKVSEIRQHVPSLHFEIPRDSKGMVSRRRVKAFKTQSTP